MSEYRCTASRLCKKPGVLVAGSRLTPCLKHLEKRASKYKNVRSESILAGRSFDSKAERHDGEKLVLRQQAGEIRNLKFQVSVPLDVNGVRICAWKADFEYEEKQPDGRWMLVWQDTKGYRTPVYELKRKLVKALYGMDIRETGTERKSFVPKRGRR